MLFKCYIHSSLLTILFVWHAICVKALGLHQHKWEGIICRIQNRKPGFNWDTVADSWFRANKEPNTGNKAEINKKNPSKPSQLSLYHVWGLYGALWLLIMLLEDLLFEDLLSFIRPLYAATTPATRARERGPSIQTWLKMWDPPSSRQGINIPWDLLNSLLDAPIRP